MSIKVKDIYWLAGLLEGEGSFIFSNGSPRITMGTVDYDVIARAYKILGCTGKIHEQMQPSGKMFYKINIQGPKAIGWMFTLYTIMGKRRRDKISDLLYEWKKYNPTTSKVNHTVNIRIINGKKDCVKHGPLEGDNVLYQGKYTRCKGCYAEVG